MNEIVFSDKYLPLFKLLESWDKVEGLGRKKSLSESELVELNYYKELSKVHTILISGGRDSGKTFAFGHFNVVAVADYGHNILYTRYTLSSSDNSIEKAQENRITEAGLLSEFHITNKCFEHASGAKIDISGQKTSSGNQTAKMKSLEGYSIFVTEEGEELTSYNDWEKITRSIRDNKRQSLSVLVFNPPTKAHWIFDEFYTGVPSGFNGVKDGVLYIHTTYLDNGKENMTITNWEKYERKRIDYELVEATSKEGRALIDPKIIRNHKDYKTTILGGFSDIAEGVIYEDWEIGEFDKSLPYVHGLDFGSNDPDVCVKVAVDEKRKRIYLEEKLFRNNLSTNELSRMLNEAVGKNELIVGDSAGKRTIGDLYDEGFDIERTRNKDVAHRIKTIQGYTLVVTENSLNLQKALNNYCWKSSKHGIPDHDWSDLCDAFGYGAMYFLQKSGSNIL